MQGGRGLCSLQPVGSTGIHPRGASTAAIERGRQSSYMKPSKLQRSNRFYTYFIGQSHDPTDRHRWGSPVLPATVS